MKYGFVLMLVMPSRKANAKNTNIGVSVGHRRQFLI
jgi:hypothetical protein